MHCFFYKNCMEVISGMMKHTELQLIAPLNTDRKKQLLYFGKML